MLKYKLIYLYTIPTLYANPHDANFQPFFAISRLSNGGEYLFQSHDENEMQAWVNAINAAAGAAAAAAAPEGAEGGRAQTLPATGSGEAKPKKGGFFTLKGKK